MDAEQQPRPTRLRLRGPLSAHEAHGCAARAARSYEPGARLVRIVGLQIRPDGRAPTWEFFYLLPRRCARLLLRVALCDDDPAAAEQANCLHAQLTPFAAPGSVLGRLSRGAPGLLDAQWRRELEAQPALPARFRDSPVALRELIAMGGLLDPAAGATLTGRAHADGRYWTLEGDESRRVALIDGEVP